MDTIEQTSQCVPLRTDYQAYDRIWQRVSPELNPYPQARMEGGGTGAVGGTAAGSPGGGMVVGGSAAVPSEGTGGASDSGLLQLPGAEADPCCMGTEAQTSLDVIRGFAEGEAADRQFYLQLSRRMRSQNAARVLRRIAAEEEGHLKKLQAVYYLITGECMTLNRRITVPDSRGNCVALRQAYHEEACSGFNYLRAADAAGDVCLQGIFKEMGEDEMRHAKALLQLLSQCLC